jgi:hypothetical protein
MLLSTFAWSTVGRIAGIAAIAAVVAAAAIGVLVVLGAVNRRRRRDPTTLTRLAPTGTGQRHACRARRASDNEVRFDYHNEVLDHVMHEHPERSDVAVGIELHELPQK